MKRIAAVLALAAAAFILYPLSEPTGHVPPAKGARPTTTAVSYQHRAGVVPLMAAIPAPPPLEQARPMADAFALDAQLRGGLEAAADDSAADAPPSPVAMAPPPAAAMPSPPLAAPSPAAIPRAKPEGAADDEGS